MQVHTCDIGEIRRHISMIPNSVLLSTLVLGDIVQ